MISFGPSPPTKQPNLSAIACRRFHERKSRSFNQALRKFTIVPSPKMDPTSSIASDGRSSPSVMILASGALFSVRALKALLALLQGVILLLLLPFRQRLRVEKAKEERKVPVVRVPAVVAPRRSSGRGSGSVGRDLEVIARRAIAVGRVAKDRDDRTKRDFSLFVTSRGETMFTQSWSPMFGKISGRYNNFAKQLNVDGYKVYGMDWIGHGGSNGLHGYVHSLDEVVSDTKEFLEKVVAENPCLPCFFFGHSTGAAIILKAILDPKVEALIRGVVLTSPAISVQPSHPIFVVLAPIMSFFLPRYQVNAENKHGLPVSRDPDALVAKYSDPLVYTGFIRVRTGYEILRLSTYLQGNLSKVSVPFLVLHGTADTVTDPEASEKLYEAACSTEKSIKLYKGFLHDLLFEPERDEIMKDIIDWLNLRLKV